MSKTIFTLYTAKWCGPCRMLKAEYLPDLKRKFPHVKYRLVDIDTAPRDQVSFVKLIPLIVIENGEESKTFKKVLQQLSEIEETLEDWEEEDD